MYATPLVLDAQDFCAVLLLIAIVTTVGERALRQDKCLQSWGRRIAALVFAGYCIRIACVRTPGDAQAWVWLVICGLLAGGLALGVTWIALALLRVVYVCLIRFPLQRLQARVSAAKNRRAVHDETCGRTEQGRTRAREAADRRSRECEENEAKIELQRRRDDARLACTAIYDQHAASLSEHFPRDRLKEYFEQFMSDSVPPEIVEARAHTLTRLIEDCVHVHAPNADHHFQSLAEIAAFYQDQRAEVTGLPYDDEIKESLLANINIQEETATRKFLTP